ncbi:hypothetical protein RS022_08960 [Candidatus Phytoplasma rubi]|uniref:Uncharacterized protein n=1 Tax=Candidatus Phytoplasma rubi TaxID=399025 RepID=A0ABY7BSZ0_9MOLU|nr:hypothetical protein RS022_08960 [Candidatus Phytoplasma rubi]
MILFILKIIRINYKKFINFNKNILFLNSLKNKLIKKLYIKIRIELKTNKNLFL